MIENPNPAPQQFPMAQIPRPAAVVEEPAAWADALDLDDSDLRHNPSPPHLLRPCTTTSNPRSSHRRIPGPASTFQDGMRLRSPLSSGAPAPRAHGQAADSDFLLDPWLRALRDLGGDCAWQRPGIGKILGDRAAVRACQVIGMVALSTPNGFGDLVLNLKDPSGTIGASVHRKVLSEGNLCKGLSVGSVIVLKKVAVFRPSHTVCYLNVTQKNLVKVFNSMNPVDCQLKQGGSSPKHGINSKAESSMDDILRKLLGGETMMSSSKVTVAEKGRHDCGTPDGSNSTSRMDAGARCSLEKNQEIELPKMVEGLCSKRVSNCSSGELQQQNPSANTRCSLEKNQEIELPKMVEGLCSKRVSNCSSGELQQQNPSANTRCSQPGSRDCTQASSTGNLRGLSDDEWMLPSSKKLKSDTVPSVGNCARTNSNISILGMDAEAKYNLENSLNTGLDDIAEEFHGDHTSIRKLEHQRKDFQAANSGAHQPTQENCSLSATNATVMKATLLSNPKKVVSVASVAEWTDDQLSQLFADY